jgi:hypothetical protein
MAGQGDKSTGKDEGEVKSTLSIIKPRGRTADKFLSRLAHVSNSRDQCEIFLRPDWMMPTHALRLPVSDYRACVHFKGLVNTG